MNRHANFWFLLVIDPGSSYSLVVESYLQPRPNTENHLGTTLTLYTYRLGQKTWRFS